MKKMKKEMDELPVFYINVDDDNKQGIRLVSLVVDPAIETKGMYFSKEELKSFQFTADMEKKKVVGPAMIPNKKILRKDETTDQMYYVVFKPETITQMVKKFNKENNNRSINVDHSNRMVNGYIEQNWIVEDPMYDKSRMYGYTCTPGTWFLEIQIEDEEFWQKEVKELGKYSFSIEGLMGMSPYKYEKEYDFNEIIDSLTESEIRYLGSSDVSFDFDGTLTQPKIQRIARQRIMKGDNVYIITKRSPSEDVYKMADDLGIKRSNVVFTSGEPKASFIKDLKIDYHYDDMSDEIKDIKEKTIAKTILV